MLKLSFDKKKLGSTPPIQTQIFNDTITKVTLTGFMTWNTRLSIPEILEFLHSYNGIGVDYTASGYIISTTGVSKKHEDDTFDDVLGYRIAESKAKLKLYKFMKNLTDTIITCLMSYCYGVHEVMDIVGRRNSKTSVYDDNLKYIKLYDKEEEHLNKLLHGINTESPQQS